MKTPLGMEALSKWKKILIHSLIYVVMGVKKKNMSKEYFDLDREVIASGDANITVNKTVVWYLGNEEVFPKLKDLALHWVSAKPEDTVILSIMNGLWDAEWTLQEDGKWLKTKTGNGYA